MVAAEADRVNPPFERERFATAFPERTSPSPGAGFPVAVGALVTKVVS
jgi:hypothetical protein